MPPTTTTATPVPPWSSATCSASVDVVLTVSPLSLEQAERVREGATTIGFLPPTGSDALVAALEHPQGARAVDGAGPAHLPRPVDGRAVVAGAGRRLPRRAGRRRAAAAVLPALHDRRRHGAAGQGARARRRRGRACRRSPRRAGSVRWSQAYDVRPASADEVRSMGATFIELELESLEGTGGYAREMTEDRATPADAAARAVRRGAPTCSSPPPPCPGRTAPRLVTRAMVEAMKPGSVVVDLAAETGGNVEGSVAGEEVRLGRHRCVLGRAGRAQPDAGARQPALRQQRRQPAAAHDRATAWSTRPRRRGHRRRARDREGRMSASMALLDHLRARGVRRLRGGLQGLHHAAHPADVGRQRDPRRHPRRRDHRGRARDDRARRWRSGWSRSCWRRVNMVGGFVVTDRMLEMFRSRKPAGQPPGGSSEAGATAGGR